MLPRHGANTLVATGRNPIWQRAATSQHPSNVNDTQFLFSADSPLAKDAHRCAFEKEACTWWANQVTKRMLHTTGEMKGQQGTEEWLRLRQGRLTASAFSNALGFWQDGRVELWEEKVGLRGPFAGNEATSWGSAKEEHALRSYSAITGNAVADDCMFKMLQDDPAHSWIGASPDGLITRPMGGPGSLGVLEIKCPFNKGKPLVATPYRSMPYYYMPQVQGLMEVFDREWCHVYSWTVNGSAIYLVQRDREYWRVMYSMLSEFWWQHVIPTKHVLAQGGDPAEVERHRPAPVHPYTAYIVQWSKNLASACPMSTHQSI